MKKIITNILVRFSPFWLFLVFFKFGAGMHYSLLSPLGERILPLWIVGAAMGAASFVQFVFDVPAGKLLDRFGYKKLLLVGTIIFLFAALCLCFNLTLIGYIASLVLSIFGWLFFGPGSTAYVLSASTKENSGVFMSMHDMAGSLGIVLSSALLSFVLFLPTNQIGWVLVGLLGLSLLLIVLTPTEPRIVPSSESTHPSRRHHVYRELRTLFKNIQKLNPASSMLLFLHLASGVFYGMIWFVIPLVIQHQAMNNELLGIGLGIFDFSIVVLGFVLGILADRADKRMLVFIGLLLFAICGMLLGLNFGIFFILFGFLATTGEEMAGLSLWSWLHVLDKKHANDGSISGVVSLFEDFGWMVGPLAAGILYTIVGPSWTIVIGSVPILLVWIAYQFSLHTHPSIHAVIPREFRLHRKRHKS